MMSPQAREARKFIRDVNIAFANELSLIADKLEINVWELIELANHHHASYSLLAQCQWALHHGLTHGSLSLRIQRLGTYRTARQVNDNKPRWVINEL